ncbi:MAG: PilX N-terminal domain-containing pilus assembly protein, partial [Mariprofundaceae bacterium]|nr:PilX N-terminal domain-containing pilus assembly protein [Mariprofundaceae bacterium]
MNQRVLHTSEQGFILATSLVMLVLLTMLSIATYYGTVISQQTSETAQSATQAYYYAETGLNYVAWALKNDAELDAYDPSARNNRDGTVALNAFAVGDRREWEANKGNPSNQQKIQQVFKGDVAPFVDVYGQLGYFDNRSFDKRPVAFQAISAVSSDTYTFGTVGSPVFHDIYTQLSGYIRLDIDAYGQITPSFSPYDQHGNNAHLCNGQTVGDIPCNGAIVWLTAGDPYTDRVLYPIDPYVAAPLSDIYGNSLALSAAQPAPIISAACMADIQSCNLTNPLPVAQTCQAAIGNCVSLSAPVLTSVDVYSGAIQKQMKDPYPAYYRGLPCDLSLFVLDKNHMACEQPTDPATGKVTGGTGTWLDGGKYGLVVYAIGFSRGKARKMIRM